MTSRARKPPRINLLDAVDERAATIARSRTALVRMGTVLAVNPDGTADVAAGGGTVTAQRFTTAPVTVGDSVAMVVDTDSWWLLGPIATT